ncbi:MAG: hypothetical protein J6U27_01930 [Spirochaetales bacterium]|nr:hypothetical protein [Spirochaetales bacterium]
MTDSDIVNVAPHKTLPITVRVPGVTTILGEFAYQSHGKVLCCTNTQELIVSLSESPDNQVHVFNSFTGDRKKFSITSLKFRKEDKWANYVKGILQQLSDNNVKLKPFNVEFSGSLLKNDGATLCAAVSVGISTALKAYLGFEISDRELAFLCYRSCTFYCGEITKFSTVLAMLCAEEGRYILFDMDSLTHVMLDDPFDDNGSLIIVDCRIPPMAMREEILYKYSQVYYSFERLKRIYPRSLKDFPIGDLIDRTIPLDDEARKICIAVLEDRIAASNMQKYFSLKAFLHIGKSLTKVGKLIRDDLEITCPEIDWLIKRALEVPSCMGASLVFNGDNVYAVLLGAKRDAPLYEAKLEEYERIFGFKAKATTLKPRGKCEIISS